MPPPRDQAAVRLAANDVAGTLAWLREHPAIKAPLHRPRGATSTGFAALDELLEGGLPAGAITELVAGAGAASAGRTSLAVGAVSAATRRGELVAWVDTDDSLDPRGLAAAGAVLEQVLWIRPTGRDARKQALQAADLVVSASGFGLLVLDLMGASASRVPEATWVRFAHRLSTGRTALVVLASNGFAGTQAHLRLACRQRRGEVEVTVSKRRGGSPSGGTRVRLAVPVD